MSNTTSTIDLEKKFAKELLTRETVIVVLEAGVFLAIGVVAVVGNSLICIAMFRNRDLRRRPTNAFILSLAVSDILMACFCMPISAGVLVRGRWIYASFACHFQAYWIYVLAGVSLYTMAVTAVNRYYRVVKPRIYTKYFTKRSTFGMIFLVWFTISTLIAILIYVSWLRVKFQSAKAACVMYAWLGSKTMTSLYQLIAFVLFFIVPTALISRCYRKVFKRVRQHQNNVVGTLRQGVGGVIGTERQVPVGRQSVEEIDITRTLFRVVLGFALCWTPVIIYEVVVISSNVFHFHDALPRQVHLIWLYFPTLGSAVNAFIYGAMNRSFRKEFTKIFWCWRKPERIAPRGFTTETCTVN